MVKESNTQPSRLSAHFEHHSQERLISQLWEQSGHFTANAFSDKPPYSIVMPPPNTTGRLHIGHAVMLAIQDALIRIHRMKGFETLWLPGTDHASIATENLVLNTIRDTEGVLDPRKHYGREALVARIKAFVEQSRGEIQGQIRAIGASCDWSRERYTMDPQLSRCVEQVFCDMYEQGIIYRGERIVNWDPMLQTNVSDDEVVYETVQSPFYTFAFGNFKIGTVRPETKFGDKYVVVHPEDTRYSAYKDGDSFTCEWINGKVRATVVKDRAVDPNLGTGAMTITPWHDPVDMEIAKRHNLDYEQIIDFDGKLMPIAGRLAGMSIVDARHEVVRILHDKGLLININESYQHARAYSARGKGAIEPQVRKQWFIDVNAPAIERNGVTMSIKEMLIQVIANCEIEIFPERMKKRYFHWVDHLRDWCVSRQIWWGHRIPVYYRGEEVRCSPQSLASSEGWVRDDDTLDTWFSSALWSWSTLVDPEVAKDSGLTLEQIINRSPDFRKFHPTSVLETGHDILFFWVSRMILMTTFALKTVPFRRVYLHGMVRTKDGLKMSKSDPSQCVDPLDSIERFGADALRISLVMGIGPGQDLRIYDEKLDGARRLVNKLWNAARYIENRYGTLGYGMLDGVPTRPAPVHPHSQWILKHLDTLIVQCEHNLEVMEISNVVSDISRFFRDEFCDWYLEMDKVLAIDEQDQATLAYVFIAVLKLFHPFAPFVTESLWQHFGCHDVLAAASWPQAGASPQDAWERFEYLKKLIVEVRSLCARIPPKALVGVTLVSEKHHSLLTSYKQMIQKLARVPHLRLQQGRDHPGPAAVYSAYVMETTIVLESETVQLQAERVRLLEQLKSEQQYHQRNQDRINHPRFQKAAPESVRDQIAAKIEESARKIQQLEGQITFISEHIR